MAYHPYHLFDGSTYLDEIVVQGGAVSIQEQAVLATLTASDESSKNSVASGVPFDVMSVVGVVVVCAVDEPALTATLVAGVHDTG